MESAPKIQNKVNQRRPVLEQSNSKPALPSASRSRNVAPVLIIYLPDKQHPSGRGRQTCRTQLLVRRSLVAHSIEPRSSLLAPQGLAVRRGATPGTSGPATEKRPVPMPLFCGCIEGANHTLCGRRGGCSAAQDEGGEWKRCPKSRHGARPRAADAGGAACFVLQVGRRGLWLCASEWVLLI